MKADLAHAEYDALRATIRERGTLRIWLFFAGMSVWGALAIGLYLADAIEGPLTIVPLMALAATFAAIYAVHVAVERIGRFIQVHYEDRALPCWETVSMMYARRFPSTGPDALFITWFWLATLLNFFLVPEGPFSARPGWLVIRLAAHLAFAWHLWTARKTSAGLRARDLERFNALKSDEPKTP